MDNQQGPATIFLRSTASYMIAGELSTVDTSLKLLHRNVLAMPENDFRKSGGLHSTLKQLRRAAVKMGRRIIIIKAAVKMNRSIIHHHHLDIQETSSWDEEVQVPV